jgi:hypothetical protein
LQRRPLSLAVDAYRCAINISVSAQVSVAEAIETLFQTGQMQRDEGFVLCARVAGSNKVGVCEWFPRVWFSLFA